MKIKFLFIFFIFSGIYANAQQKQIDAIKISDEIKIDGVLDEKFWDGIPFATDFIQYEPSPGIEATQKSNIKIAYSDQGIYIGAQLYDERPDLVFKELSRRDEISNVDWFKIIIDTYSSGVNAFAFGVTAVGVQIDSRFTGNNEDFSWDAVWESKTRINNEGWIAELFIPYSALRFPETKNQDWQVQFVREIRRNRELVYWNPVNPDISGIINQSGKLSGIKDIQSPIRLSLFPFIVSYVGNSKIDRDYSFAYNAGLDLKYGLSDAFTLDMALIPDFGQTLSDNLVLNLSPFEVYYEENRPFFTEGLEYFDKGDLFYSRRIGSRLNLLLPELNPTEEYIDIPGNARLFNATKFSGRLNSGTGIGVFNAVERNEYVRIKNNVSGEVTEIEVNPLTNYNVVVLDQNLKNNSSISLMNTNTWRAGDNKDANVTGLFFNLKNKNQLYGVAGDFTYSHTSLINDNTGYAYNIEGGKISGKYRASLQYSTISDHYDINDLGFLFNNNEREIGLNLSLVNNRVSSPRINKYIVDIDFYNNYLFNPARWRSTSISSSIFILLNNRVGMRYEIEYKPNGTHDYFEPRTLNFSNYYHVPASTSFFGLISSDYRKKLAIDIRTQIEKFESNQRTNFYLFIKPRIRINNKMSLTFNSKYELLIKDEGYVSKDRLVGDIPMLNQEDILIGTRDRKIIENVLSFSYIFNERSSVNLRTRHYWGKVKYIKLNILEKDGSVSLFYDLDNNSESIREKIENSANYFNVDANFIWRFAPGSDLILNWKNVGSLNGFSDEDKYFEGFRDIFDEQLYNSFSIKIIYFFDVNTLRTRRNRL